MSNGPYSNFYSSGTAQAIQTVNTIVNQEDLVTFARSAPGTTSTLIVSSNLAYNSNTEILTFPRLKLIDVSIANNYVLMTLTGLFYIQNFISGVLTTIMFGNQVNFAISGNLFAASYSISCRNRKQNIEDLSLDYCSDLILKLKPKKYQYKKMYDASGNETTRPDIDRKTSFGFIAQEIKEDICGCEDLGIHVEGDGNLFPQALSYTELIAPLVKVVQDLMKKNEDLTQRVIQLESSLGI